MRTWPDNLAALVLCGMSIGVIAQVIFYMRYGFDFTDEAYYLIWMKNPFDYDFSISQAGYVYYPLFYGMSQDIHLVRVANIVITYTLSFVFSFSVLRIVGSKLGSGVLRVSLALALATASVIFLFTFLPTPSYNNLSFQALVLTAIGLVHADRVASKESLVGWVLIGIGGWLAFMAKLSTAAALAPVILALVILSGKWSLRGLATAIGAAALLLAVSAISIDGSIGGFWNRILVGLKISGLIGAGYTIGDILRWDNISLAARDWPIALVTVSFLILSSIIFRRKPSALISGRVIAIHLACCITMALVAIRLVPPPVTSKESARTVLLAFPLASLIVASPSLVRLILAQRSDRTPINLRRNYVLGIGFCLMPLLYAFGSNNNYWNLAGDACLFWILAGVLFVVPSADEDVDLRRFIPFALASPLLSLFYFQHGLAAPYRQPQPLWLNNQTVEFGEPPSTLVVSSGYAAYIAEAKKKAREAGFQAGTPVIDLSGQSPGILFAIGARNAGYPWLSGGYPGSAVAIRAMLGRVPCVELANAWVLLERDGPRAVDSSVLSVFGANIDTDFAVAAEWRTAAGAGGYQEPRTQQLLRPLRGASSAASACAGTVRTSDAKF